MSWVGPRILYLVSLPVFSNSGPIKVGGISSSILTPESDQAYNRAAKIQIASRRSSSNVYQQRHIPRTSSHARTDWLL